MTGVDTDRPHESPFARLDRLNQDCLWRLGLMVALTLLFASTAPAGLVLASFSTLSFLGAVGLTGLALALGESPWAPHLTRWDEAAALMVLSMAAAWLVDPQQVAAILETLPAE